MKYKIIVDKQPANNPSSGKKEYEIEIEELKVKGNIYDSLVITKEEDYVIRRLSLSEYYGLTVLENPIKEPLTDLNIELFEGDNYIYLSDMEGNKFYAEYLVKNDFTDLYVTRNEMNSSINQTVQNIELSVNQKLEEYSTTEEMNATIELTAQGINSEVSKKVGKDEVVSSINQSAEEIKITGNRFIVDSNNFKLTKEGNMTCNNGNFNGDVNINAGDTLTIKDSNNNKLTVVDEGGLRFFDSNDQQTNTISRTVSEGQEGISLKTSHGNTYISIADRNDIIMLYRSNIDKMQFFCDVDMGNWNLINASNVVVTNQDNPTVRCLEIIDSPEGVRYMRVFSWGDYVAGIDIWASDGRLKKNIKTSNVNALDVIKQIKHKQFDWKSSLKHEEIGYIAQELKEINSDFVLEVEQTNGEKILQISETKIIPYITKAIQEQQEEIEKLKKQNLEQQEIIEKLLEVNNIKIDKQTQVTTKRKVEKIDKSLNYEDINVSISNNKKKGIRKKIK